jgi:tetratricopeptide (TPR) repeat protein
MRRQVRTGATSCPGGSCALASSIASQAGKGTMTIFRTRDQKRAAMKGKRSARVLLLCMVAIAAAAPGGVTAAPADTKLGKWLVEEGRSYALSSQARGTEADARIVLSLMQAATQVDPRQPEGYRWQYETAELLGEAEIAREALQYYTVYKVSDVTRRLQWIGMRTAELQTAEERIRFLDEILEKSTSMGALGKSDIHRRKAALFYGQGKVEEADENVREALTFYPGNTAALQLSDEFHQRIPGEQAEAFYWLMALSENPTSWENSVNLARELDCLGLRAEAREWYQYAAKLLERADADGALQADVLLAMARSCKSDGKPGEAQRLCSEAISKNPTSVAGRLLLSELCGGGEEGQECVEARRWLAEHHEQLAARLAAKPDPTAAAALSWYYGRVLGDSDKAVGYGDQAVRLAPDNPVSQSCAGYAHLWAGQPERAAELLAASAKVDARSAVGLGRAYLAMGRVDEGAQLLDEVSSSCACGEAYDAAVAALKEAGREPPVLPDTTRLSERLRQFNRAKLAFAFDPDRYLGYRVELVGRPSDATVPWEFRFTLVNRGGFDITLGPDKMVDSHLSITIELRDEQGEVEALYEDYTTVSLDERPVLRAGQFTEAYRVVDTGPLREFLWRTAQADFEVRVRVILSPVTGAEGKSVRSPYGPSPYEFSFHRPGLVASPGNLERLFQASRSEAPLARAPAVEKLVALWAEQQAYERAPKSYIPDPIPVAQVREAVAERWNDEDQGVRLRVLGALRLVNLDNSEISSLASLLHHEDPLTRMEAVLLMADQHGTSFLPVVAGMADRDPDPLVRQLCAGFRDNWASAESPGR